MSYPVVIHAKTRFLPDHLPPEEKKYAFAYHITIHNKGSSPIKLLSRYWLITDGNGKQTEVTGEGVVGKQPIIAPNDEFSYSSGAIIETPVGTMQGFYEMREIIGSDATSKQFRAPIDVFSLAVPKSIN